MAKFHRVSIGFPEGEVPEARVRYSKMGEQIAEYKEVLKNSAGKIQMIDFENTSLHIRMQDLAHLLYRNFPWQGERMIRWIEYYDSKRTLSKGEKLMLRLLLLVPYPAIRS